MFRYSSATGSRPCSTSRSLVWTASHPFVSSAGTVASRTPVSFPRCGMGEYDGLRSIATSCAKAVSLPGVRTQASRAASHALAVCRSDGRSISMMRGTSTVPNRPPSATTALRNRRILCTPPPTASAAARRTPALRPYTPPVTQGGWIGSSLTVRTKPPYPPIDRLPVLPSHHRVDHGAKDGAGRHGAQPLDQRVERRGCAALDHCKGPRKPRSVKQAPHGREICSHRTGETGAPEGLEGLEQAQDLRLARYLHQGLGDRNPSRREPRAFPTGENQAVHPRRGSFRSRGGA